MFLLSLSCLCTFISIIYRRMFSPFFLCSGGEKTGIPFLDVKHEIEMYIRSLKLPYNVFLHTCYFYENLVSKGGNKRVQADSEHGLIFSTPLPKDLPIPMISAFDIGRIAAEVLMNPDKFTSKTRIFLFLKFIQMANRFQLLEILLLVSNLWRLSKKQVE